MPLLFFQSLGGPEIAVLVILALLLFGAKRIPELFASIGQGMREFKKAVSGEGEPVSSSKEEEKKSSEKN